MKVIDLTHTITEDMPVYPGTERPRLTPANSYEADGFRETLIRMYSHTGTHIDPPAHIFPEGRTLDSFPPEQFLGKALVIDCRDLKDGEEISLERIQKYGEPAQEADFLLFNTGYDRLWGTEAYFGDYPCLSAAALEYIISGGYKGIGFDVIGLDPIADAGLTRHRRLFSECNMINIENLCNLDKCPAGLFSFACLPLKTANGDGAPARAVAW